MSSGKYPPEMLKFIERNIGKVDRNMLREVVNTSIKEGTVNNISWDKVQLPTHTKPTTTPKQGPNKPGPNTTRPVKGQKQGKPGKPTPVLRQPPRKAKPAPPGKASAPQPIPKQKAHAVPVKVSTPQGKPPAKSAKKDLGAIIDPKKYVPKIKGGPHLAKQHPMAKQHYHINTEPQSPDFIPFPAGMNYFPNKSYKRESDEFDVDQQPELRTKKARLDRQARFATPEPTSATYVEATDSNGPIVGTSTALEKDYYRITGPVNPQNVRPAEILELSFDFVMKKYAQSQGYDYIRNQLQAIRQDLKVQHLNGDLSLKVYSTNARVALENGDVGEFNKCLQATLDLREQNNEFVSETNEFVGLNILYMIRSGRWDHLSANARQLELSDSNDTNIQLALDVLHAVNRGDKRQLFVCCSKLSELGLKVIEPVLRREQLAAIAELVWACRSVPASFVAEALSLDIPAFEQLLERNGIPSKERFERTADYDCIYKALTTASIPVKI